MTLGHIIGIPVEESVLALAPAGAAMMTAIAALFGRLRWPRRGSSKEVR